MQAGSKVTPHQRATIAKYACSRTFVSNSSSVISTFSEAMTPVTIHMHARACLRVMWQCPYILGFSLAGAMKLYRSNSQP